MRALWATVPGCGAWLRPRAGLRSRTSAYTSARGLVAFAELRVLKLSHGKNYPTAHGS